MHRCADGSYFATRYRDLGQVYRDRVRFSSHKRSVFGPVFGVASPLYAHHTTSLVFNDAPYHTRVRRPLVEALSASVVRGLEAGITSLVDALLAELFGERRRHPGPDTDVLTCLLREKELSEDELLQNCVFLLNAGHETTTNIIANGLHLLLRTPAAAQRLREDPTLADPAIEECLRLESPTPAR